MKVLPDTNAYSALRCNHELVAERVRNSEEVLLSSVWKQGSRLRPGSATIVLSIVQMGSQDVQERPGRAWGDGLGRACMGHGLDKERG